MRNLTRNVWICLGLIMFPLTTFGQQKSNFTYVPAQELLLVGKATTEGEYFHRVDTAKYCKEAIHQLCGFGYFLHNEQPGDKS